MDGTPLCAALTLGDFFNILVVFPFPTSSHTILGEGYVKPLLNSGYSVTYITPKPLKHHENLTQIDLSFLMANDDDSPFNLTKIMLSEVGIDHSLMFHLVNQLTTVVCLHPEVQDLIHDTTKIFDLIIIEWMFTEIFSGHMHTKDEEVYMKAFKSAVEKKYRKLPAFEEIRYKASMVLGNSHTSLGTSVRLPQNYKSIGGYHIDDKVQPLPVNLKDILDNSTNGVIYFSMGSVLKSKDWPSHLKNDLKNMFGRLKQTVIWKLEEPLTDAPRNVHIFNWLPQQSILAHPNMVIFITHGGLLSSTEAVHFGVPIIGIPVFGDQELNIDRATKKGFGKKVNLNDGLVSNLKEAITDLLSHSNYTDTVKKLSFIYHDRLVSPKVELIHWVRHVIETQGAAHLASPALLVSWYQKMYLDLMFIVILAISPIGFLIKNLKGTKVYLNKKNK